jgi:hypothetical protein
VRSDVQSYISGANVTAGDNVALTALENATITALERSDIKTKEGTGGVIATNVVLSKSNAFIVTSLSTMNALDLLPTWFSASPMHSS